MNDLKLSKLLETISFKLKSSAIYFELKHYIVNKESYLRHIYYWERGIGKTYNLIKLARKYSLPIFVPNSSSELYIRRIEKKYFKNNYNKNIKVIVANERVVGKRIKLALIDEGIDIEVIESVIKPMCECLVGYKSRY